MSLRFRTLLPIKEDAEIVQDGDSSPMLPADANSEAVLTAGQVRGWALEAGFSEAGVVALPYADEERDAARFAEWAQAGRAGTMQYMTRSGEDGRLARSRVAVPFPWARSAIVCFARYAGADVRSRESAAEGAGWIARYAWSGGRDAKGELRASDYHKVLLKRLKTLEARLRLEIGSGPVSVSQVSKARPGAPVVGFESRAYVDTGPVVERALARAAGLGWVGKNTCLIHPKLGSFGFLAVLLTSLRVEDRGARAGLVPDRCGSCRRCLDACPTGALIAPYKMDARKCISYLTIEHRGAIDGELMAGMGRQVFGCDICQDVCPWNRPGRMPIHHDGEMETRGELVNPALEWLAEMEEAEWERRFNGSPVRRAGWPGWRRNVAIAMGNSGLRKFAARLEEWTDAADEGVRTAARWAIGKLQGAEANEIGDNH